MSTRKREKVSEVFSDRLNSLIGNETVSAFARRVGLKQASVDRYAKAVHAPHADALLAIATHCGVTTDWLLGLAEQKVGVELNIDWKSKAQQLERKLDSVNKALSHVIKSVEELQEAVR